MGVDIPEQEITTLLNEHTTWEKQISVQVLYNPLEPWEIQK